MISNVTGIGRPQITDQGAECLLELLTHHNTSLSAINLRVSISFSSICSLRIIITIIIIIIIIIIIEDAEHHHHHI
jgi:hypothetical protein